MNRVSRAAVAGALAAAVALGAAAPAAVAAPKAGHAKVHHKAVKAKAHAGKAHHVRKVRGAKADRSVSPQQRRLTRRASRKVAYLERLADARKVDRLPDEVEALVVANIAGDVTEIGDLVADLSGATRAELKDTRHDLRGYRPEVYRTIVNQLRMSTRLQPEAEGTEEADALDDLVATLTGNDAETKRTELRATKRILISVKEALEDAGDAETGTDSGTDTGPTLP